jgi:multicomponent Na+:H+ antiporter subunit D
MDDAELIRQLAERWNAGDLDGVVELYTEDAVIVSGPEWPEQVTWSGHEGIKASLLDFGAVWQSATTGSLAFDPFALHPATALILLAFLLSAAVPVLHAWLPDAYPAASAAGTVFLSAYTTKAAVYALARGFPGWPILIVLGVAMALYGVVYAVLENDTRRLLAYHIVSQVGYMVAGVGIGTEAALNGTVAHAFAHILYKALLLMGTGAVLQATGRAKMSELGGIARRMRVVLVLYLVGAASISSVPLFSGFVAKEMVVDAAALTGLAWPTFLLHVASVGTFLHTGLKLPYGTWFGSEGWGPPTNAGARVQVGPVPPSMYVAMGLAAVLNTAIGVFPALLYDLLPFPTGYEPYALANVVSKVQLLTFTGLAFWLLLPQLAAKAKVSADVDVIYRKLLHPLTVRFTAPAEGAALGAGAAATPDAAPDRELARQVVGGTGRDRDVVATVRSALDPDRTSPAARPAILPTWILGAVIVATAVVTLLLSLVPQVVGSG